MCRRMPSIASSALPAFAGPVISSMGTRAIVAHGPDALTEGYAGLRRRAGYAAVRRRGGLPGAATEGGLRGAALADRGRPRVVGHLGLGLGRLCALLGPVLIELHAPCALLVLAQREAGAERASAAAAKAGHRPRGVALLDQFPRDGDRKVLAGLGLPDHKAAPRVLARPARVALAVLDDLVPAYGAGTEPGPRDAHVFERLVELLDRLAREPGDVAHELLARVLTALDLAEAMLPAARQARGRDRMLVEQPDHVQPLLRRHQSAAVALEIADLQQALDDRRARRGRADTGVLHGL